MQGLRANSTMYEVSKGLAEKMALMDKIAKMPNGDGRTLASPLFPMVFIGGNWLGFGLPYSGSYLWRVCSSLKGLCSLALTSFALSIFLK